MYIYISLVPVTVHARLHIPRARGQYFSYGYSSFFFLFFRLLITRLVYYFHYSNLIFIYL